MYMQRSEETGSVMMTLLDIGHRKYGECYISITKRNRLIKKKYG